MRIHRAADMMLIYDADIRILDHVVLHAFVPTIQLPLCVVVICFD
jgi:hypothetical protein